MSFANAPNLRRMSLQSVTFLPGDTFPLLTHLALEDVETRDCVMGIANLVSRCPNLESLLISYPEDIISDEMVVPEDKPDNHPLTLSHLSRVSLRLPPFEDALMRFFLSMIGTMGSTALADTRDARCHPRPVQAIQINDLDVMDFAELFPEVLLQATRAKASHLALSLDPTLGDDCSRQLVLSARGPEGTFHISTDTFEDSAYAQFDWDDLRFVLSAGQHLQAMREVWITGIPPQNNNTAAFKSVIAALPALETIVFVITQVTSETGVDAIRASPPKSSRRCALHTATTVIGGAQW